MSSLETGELREGAYRVADLLRADNTDTSCGSLPSASSGSRKAPWTFSLIIRQQGSHVHLAQ